MTPTEPWTQVSNRPPVEAPTLPLPSVVTQDELRQLQALQQQRRESDRLRKSILKRLRAGAGIESGPLTAEIEEKCIRQITRTALEDLWGNEYVENLRHHLPETVQHHLKITNQSNHAEL